jgi:cysteine desulfurase
MIYADNAATTKIDDQVFAAMLPYLKDEYGNASSQYTFGHSSKRAIERAREQVSIAIGAQAKEVFFTSGGSESDNWAIWGAALANRAKGKHIITSAIEHLAVLNTCASLKEQGFDITYLPVDNTGKVDPRDVAAAIKPTTILVSVMMANNEVGTIQPIREIGKITKEAGILLHTDAVQTIGHIPVNVDELGVDLLSASAHKFYGPKGTGFLYIRESSPISRFIYGGHQEKGFRAGTENVAGIVGTGKAVELSMEDLEEQIKLMRLLSDITFSELRSRIPDVIVNGHPIDRLPGNVNISFPDVEGEAMMLNLNLKGICVSTSSACNSGTDNLSHVLLGIGATPKQANNTIRISYGKYNSETDARTIIDDISAIYRKLNKTA